MRGERIERLATGIDWDSGEASAYFHRMLQRNGVERRLRDLGVKEGDVVKIGQLELERALGGPVTAPSANPSGAPPPRTAREVVDLFEGKIELVLDAGRTAGGLPSTVVDATVVPPTILRAGAVTL